MDKLGERGCCRFRPATGQASEAGEYRLGFLEPDVRDFGA
jgi:hypothetical protein